MGLKVIFKGEAHKFYEIEEIQEIIIYGYFEAFTAPDEKTGKNVTHIYLAGMKNETGKVVGVRPE